MPADRLKKLNSQFAHLRLEDYLHQYTDRSASCRVRQPDKEELENIFNSMLKHTESSRKIDCECCGYETCEKMAIAIYNVFNNKIVFINVELMKTASLKQNAFREAVLVFISLNPQQ